MKRSQTVYMAAFGSTMLLVWLAWFIALFVLDGGAFDGAPEQRRAVLVMLTAFALPGGHFVAKFAAQPSWRRRDLYVTWLPTRAMVGFGVVLFALFIAPSLVMAGLLAHVDATSAGAGSGEETFGAYGYIISVAVSLGLLVGVVVGLRSSGQDICRDLGFRTGRFWRHVGLGVAAYAAFRWAILPVLSTGLELGFRLFDLPVKGHEIVEEYEQTRSLMARLGILLAILVEAPLIEEVVFRGVLFQSIKRYGGGVVAIVASAVVFGVLHPGLFVKVNIFFLGLVFGYLFDKTGSIVPGIVLHFLFNLTPAIAMMLQG